MNSATGSEVISCAAADTPPAHWAWRLILRTLLVAMASSAAVFVVFMLGWNWRQELWAESAPIRFRYDLDNAVGQCLAVAADAGTGKPADRRTFWRQYFAHYDKIAKAHPDGQYGLDYGPLRLLVMSAWERHLLLQPAKTPSVGTGGPTRNTPPKWTDRDVAPLRHLNSLMDFIAALLAAGLVWTWVARSRGGADPLPWFGPLCARWGRAIGRRLRGGRFTTAASLGAATGTVSATARYPADTRPLRSMLVDGRAWIWGGVAGALVWLSPALIVVGNGWPQWDGWVVPFFLLAALLCSWRCWFSAGVVIAVGAMFKGQLLLGAPVLMLWPLFGGRYALAFRIVAGGMVGFAALGSPWLLKDRPAEVSTDSILPKSPPPAARPRFRPGPRSQRPAAAPAAVSTQPATPSWLERRLTAIPNWGFLATTAAGIGLMAPWFYLRRTTWRWWACAGAAAVLVSWPWWRSSSQWWFWGGLGLIDLLLLGPWLLPRRHAAAWAGAVLAVAVFFCAPLFGGSLAWWRIGITYGTDHYSEMRMGPTYNLSAILGDRYGWKLKDNIFEESAAPPARPRFGPGEPRPATPESKLELRTLLRGCYLASLLLCGIGAAAQTRRHSPRVLVALSAPWVLFFALLPQMHERYLVYAGGICAIAVAAGSGFGLMHVALSLLGASQMIMVMMMARPQHWPDLSKWLPKTYPDAAWAVLVIAAVFLWCGLTPGRRPKAKSSRATG